ncbi:MAG TPA: hypothetical protein DER60_12655 [Syntrophomonas sp.]|nr:hypothetical protein [Syntrophomonas sp.]
MAKKDTPELDKLFQEIGTYRRSQDYSELLKFIKKFPEIASFNAMLINIQKPGSQYVALASVWRERFGRHVVPGGRPLVILRPFGPVTYVFELGDTVGTKPFPPELLNPFRVEGRISTVDYNNLLNSLINYGIAYYKSDHGSASAGFIQTNRNPEQQTVVKSNKVYWIKVLFNMVLNRNHPIETKFATIVHELGHLFCGHLGSPSDKWWTGRPMLHKDVKEFEAESVCWLVCERMGIHNPSAEYLNGYLGNNEEIPDISIETVLKAVNMVETMIKGTSVTKKEIIEKTATVNNGIKKFKRSR